MSDILSDMANCIPGSWRPLLRNFWNAQHYFSLRHSEKLFSRGASEPSYLADSMIETLIERYPYQVRDIRYDPDGLVQRGKIRAKQVLNVLPRSILDQKNNMLELGCADGMVSYHLAQYGINTYALDIRDIRDPRMKSSTAHFVNGDVNCLPFEDNYFNAILSFDSFEHFLQPDAALREMIRVVRQGGYIYLEFGPLYYSAGGLHAYRDIALAYPQVLFSLEHLRQHMLNKNATADWMDDNYLNKFSASQYQDLFSRSFSDDLDIMRFDAVYDYSGLSMIQRFPSCFQAKKLPFENYILSRMLILLKKKTEQKKSVHDDF